MDPGSKPPLTQCRPHAEPGRDDGARSAAGTGTALIVFGLRPSTPPWPRGGRPGASFEIPISVNPEFRPQSQEGPERGEHRTDSWREQGWRTLGRG